MNWFRLKNSTTYCNINGTCIKCRHLCVYNKTIFNKYDDINKELNFRVVLNVFQKVLYATPQGVLHAIYTLLRLMNAMLPVFISQLISLNS